MKYNRAAISGAISVDRRYFNKAAMFMKNFHVQGYLENPPQGATFTALLGIMTIQRAET